MFVFKTRELHHVCVYYASMLRCWHLVWILVRTEHPCLGVGCHILSFYLGIKVHQGDSGITLRQTAYVKRVVELAGLTDCNSALTPMEERLKLSRNSTTEEVDAMQYQRLVGSIHYLANTRSDLAFFVAYVSRFMQ
jgi:hypothetical protein